MAGAEMKSWYCKYKRQWYKTITAILQLCTWNKWKRFCVLIDKVLQIYKCFRVKELASDGQGENRSSTPDCLIHWSELLQQLTSRSNCISRELYGVCMFMDLLFICWRNVPEHSEHVILVLKSFIQMHCEGDFWQKTKERICFTPRASFACYLSESFKLR